MLIHLPAESARRLTLSWVSLWLTTAFFRYFEMDIERPGVPNVEAQDVWFHQQPAYQEHGMLSFENLFTQLAY
jgi:hypothetical protein